MICEKNIPRKSMREEKLKRRMPSVTCDKNIPRNATNGEKQKAMCDMSGIHLVF